MEKYKISINPLAEYFEATESRRTRILQEQQNPNPVKIPHYQLAKARIKKSIELSGSLVPVNDGIKLLKARKPENVRKKNDIINSVFVLEKYKQMLVTDLITKNEVEIIKVAQKFIDYNGIRITISPNIVFRITVNGEKRIGACKIHVSKGKPFSTKQSKLVASLLELYLNNCVVAEDEIVDPVLCICLDPFAGTTINANSKVALDMLVVKDLCKEIRKTIDEASKAA